ncbi:MAG: epoxyqueuosine reductase QueH [Nitrospirae bacterium]|nr:epoxyqueuosine reductase QueH [Nitrospirota bacterium]
MHICCANCSLYPLKSMRAKEIEVTGFWFNPNIHPYPEYSRRLDSLRTLERLWGLSIEYADRYGIEEFVGKIGDPDRNRCLRCYAMRLEETAKTAKKMHLDGFTTSLLVSPYQDFGNILSVGREMARRHSVPFYEEDFRAGYKEAVSLSKELGLYRQKYCGCLFSEKDRGRKKGGAPASGAGKT